MTSTDELMPLIEKSWKGFGSIRFSIHPRFQGINNVWYLERLMWDFDVSNENVHPRLIIEVAINFAKHLSRICNTKPLIVYSGMKGAHVVAFLSENVASLTQDKPQNILEYVHAGLYKELTNYIRGIFYGIDNVLEDSGANYKVLTKMPYTRHEKTLNETHFVDYNGYYVSPLDSIKLIDEAIENPITECVMGNMSIDVAELVKNLMESYEEAKKEVEESTARVMERIIREPSRRGRNKFAELLLEKAPNDCKKRLMIVVLAPYLVNERGVSEDEAIEVLHKWCVEGGGRDRECRTVARNAVKNAIKKQLIPPHNPLKLLQGGWNRAFHFDECKDLLNGIATLIASQKAEGGVGRG
jgi:hypothetical protein